MLKQEDLKSKGEDLESKPPHLRTKDEWLEIIPEGLKSKVNFTVSIDREFNDKFNDIFVHYQSKHKYGKVYKTQVLQLIIDEVYTRMHGQRLI
jgi:hypothetical protein